MSHFPFYKQPDAMDCGPTCLRMIAKHYGRTVSLQKLRMLSETTRAGSSILYLSKTAEQLGFRTVGIKTTFQKLAAEAPLPAIVYWQQNHFVIVYKIKKEKVWVADPAHGLITYSLPEFLAGWIGPNATPTTEAGIGLLLEPTPKLMEEEEDDLPPKRGLGFLFQYIFRYKRFMAQLFIGLLVTSLLQLIHPFLAQSVMDIGIKNGNLHFIYLMLVAQILLFLGRSSIQIIRSWLLLHISTRVNITLISDFFLKLMRLPISFFDVKMTGDLMQRINDHDRIRKLLTTTTLNTLFSFVQLFIFIPLLIWYHIQFFFIYCIGGFLHILWIMLFLSKRKTLDYKQFAQSSKGNSKIMELLHGMQEIKLHNAETQKRWEWEYLQAALFKLHVRQLSLEQIESIGANILHEIQNILVSILSATLVIHGQITIGMMMAISYVMGQLNSPIEQLINLIYTIQDTLIALERLSEIHQKPDEQMEPLGEMLPLPRTHPDLILESVSFRYTGKTTPTLQNITLTIPAQKLTAIVGMSGSGKTTLMKLLLKFYETSEGSIRVGNIPLSRIAHATWRHHCGVVMQEGFLFNDTIAHNIAVGQETVDIEKLLYAAEIASLTSFIESLPLGYNTRVGVDGVSISTGEKQRILIARAVYKNPQCIFFDEATSSLDANNEHHIMDGLAQFFKNRTAVVIAHRLSTVRNAHQIIVLDHGKVVEQGTHQELLDAQGAYYALVKNQLNC
ncbi:peptidase domain-containing ABC transporter [Cardinium endosymbiont of Culicoides punctatus]|uniref:peptidase domain-containing ABC transporter n=1 Tax=Cardinium endosymbiont of Culicoides punctatus TaxID=2304601 RepID=UPI001058826C|nr:peptidase domain-containing ABC transporter [Cardinium endosymbiont of Culicoides punctatus]TDG95772.1 Lactococcin-G-processing and transport ATP-binding protein LagD [Cardinium endosymbiont of Culicoides punctatus]